MRAQMNQFTGFNLKGYTVAPSFSAPGDPVWGDASFDAASFGDWSFEGTEWGGWDAAPGENPADCLGGNPGVTDLVNTITDGEITAGDVAYGDIAYGEIMTGAVTPSGPATLSATYGSVTKAL